MEAFEKWDNTQCCEAQDGELCEKISGCCACTEARKQAWRAALEYMCKNKEFLHTYNNKSCPDGFYIPASLIEKELGEH